MILSLAGKYRKLIAGFLAGVFYLQLVLPLYARAEIPDTYQYRKSPWSVYSPKKINSINEVANTSLIESEKKLDKEEKQSPGKFEEKNIGGPGQPEMSSFQSVNGNNMVDLFSGDFSYNIPLMDVGGYPVNIHYSSGVTMDQEASWVGLGWNINPGTVNRNMRGLPDDFNGTDSITKTQNIKKNKTTGVKLGAQAELAGFPLTVGAGFGVFHNNYNGWGIEQSLNAAISLGQKSKGELNSGDTTSGSSVSLGLGLSNNSQTGLSASPSLNVKLKQYDKTEGMRTTNFGISTNYHTRAGLSSLTISAMQEKQYKLFKEPTWGTMAGMNVNISFAQPSVTPGISMPTTSSNFVFHAKTGGEAFGFHGNVFVEGYVNSQEIKAADQVQKLPAYGYIYFSDANNNQRALLDFNREKELQFNYKSTPNIAIPQYTYDVYSVSGEGTGGTIRPYRGDVGYVRDHYMRTKSNDNQFSVEFGAGNLLHGGFSYDFVKAYTENSSWDQQNALRNNISFQKSDSLYQSVYFRNPAEKTSNTSAYYQQVGDDALMRVKLDRSSLSNVRAASNFLKYKNGYLTGNLAVSNSIQKKERDKKSQVVTYLNAQEAALYGLTKQIYSYKENTVPLGSCQDTVEVIDRVDNEIHKKNHISEIDVLNPDGRRYIYGIPAYNIEQKDITFSVDKETNAANIDSGLVRYSTGDNSVNNNKGKESYYNEEKIPAYAHSYLLTGILSPDYVDIKEDGITEDDQGDAVRFNYTRVYGPQSGYFEWRTPGSPNKGNYNEGFKTYSRDDKATYLYGKKEVWYTHSIESKTMIALFKISSDRKDAYAAAGENGGINKNKALRKLDRIELYAKADLIKNGNNAKPIKTVHFEYNYDLCKGYNGNSNEGKLTLKKIWFSYNGNDKGKQNPYSFNYHSSNPDYHPKKYDRWGNYKDQSSNPVGLNNADFPYAEKDSVKAAQNAGAWNLADIKLPSGGRMKITYESDDYAYVQNKRAEQMFTIAGFGQTPTDNPGASLYGGSDNEYVFVNSSIPVADAKDVFRKYLEGNEWIYMKMAVIMPTDRWGSGYEFVPVYGKIAEFGKVNGQNRFWIKFEKVQGVSPMVRSALQFLKNNLTSKAYPTSELGDNVDLGDAVKMLLSSIGEIKNAVSGFENASKSKGWCKTVDIAKSFIRLNAPEYKKMGGGLRVKRVEIFDNWKAMTNQRESVYGQEYSYRTSIDVDGKKQIISSGVATYEPMIGNEENPFRQPINYSEKIAPLAPVTFLYSEMPLGESYFPGASVGYSKVRVRTINPKARSANGWEETEFYTSKDFPTIVEHTLLDQDAKARYKPKLPSLLKIYAVERTTVSQGFKIELNDMNGKVKRTASYAENDSLNPIAYSLNFYKVDDDRAALKKLNNTVWVVDSVNGRINRNGTIGKDIELMTDFRQQYSNSVSGGISPNLDGFMVGPFFVPIPSFFKFPSFDETMFRSAATVKVVQRYGILDSVVAMDKGSVISTKNLLYDGETGEVILSRTNNEFNDPIYNFNYAAHWAYSGLGMAYKNADAVFKGLKLVNGKLYYPGTNAPFPVEKYFESGDECWLTGRTQYLLSGESCLDFSFLQIGTRTINEKIWVIDAFKGKEAGRGLYFIDKDGKPITGRVDIIKVLRSGKRNMLDASVGSIVAMDNPIREISPGNYKLVIDSAIKIINASVSTYNDLWKVENSFYAKDTTIRVTRNYSVLLNPTDISRRVLYARTSHPDIADQYYSSVSSVVSSYNYIRGGTGCNSRQIFSKSMLRFDFSSIPAGAVITDARISFTPRKPENIWPVIRNDCSRNFSSYDWTTANNYFLGDSRVNFKRITGSWGPTTRFRDFQTSSINQVVLSSSNQSGVNCTTLIQDIINSPVNNGFMFEVVKESPTSGNSTEINYLSFCASAGGSTGLNGCPNNTTSTNTIKKATGTAAAAPACPCFRPQLQISYSIIKDTVVTVCRYNINDTSINPYRWGILGNWRMEKAYTYYHERKESDASSAQTDIRKEGVLKSFTPFWKFTDSVLLQNPDTTKWVWNSAMSAYNRKGFETENYDPLGRFNSGLYGYNQTLPVAITQNGKYREMLSDGFEDYGYKTKNCTICESPREFDFVKDQQGASLNEAESHSGKFSLKVNAGYESKLSVPLSTNTSDSAAALSVKIDSTPIFRVNVTGKGRGLNGIYQGRRIINNNCSTQPFTGTRIDPMIDFNWGTTSPFPGMCYNPISIISYSVSWNGKLQAQYTGYHRFYLEYAGAGNVSVTRGTKTVSLTTTGVNGKFQTDTIYLKAGELYDIAIGYSKLRSTSARIKLSWSEDQNLPEQAIPQSFLYPNPVTQNDTAGSVQSNVKFYCIKMNNPKPRQIIRPVFSPTTGSKMVVSGWVKMEGADCNTAPALNDVIIASFNINGSNNSISLQKTGVRIEGWQRYESVVDIPANAAILYLSLKGAQGRNVFVDDIRMQPFNSNMKSYIYDPVSLRLMAELDENNYASFYEYDDDGTLIRVKKETVKGIKTVQETRSALIKE
jgi:hypothetical protein